MSKFCVTNGSGLKFRTISASKILKTLLRNKQLQFNLVKS